MTASAHALELLKVAAAAADSKAGEDLVAIDVSNPLPLADIFLIVTGRSERNVVAIAGEIGYPILLKATAGGGGKGMRLVEHEKDLASAVRTVASAVV